MFPASGGRLGVDGREGKVTMESTRDMHLVSSGGLVPVYNLSAHSQIHGPACW